MSELDGGEISGLGRGQNSSDLPHPSTGNRDAGGILRQTTVRPGMKGAQIACSDSDAGEPVLLIHCSATSSAEWNNLRDTLDKNFHVIAPDQWGCGESAPWTGQGEFNLAQEAAPLLGIIAGLGVAVHLIGHSYGGGVALHIARERPDLIRSLTLIEPSAFPLLCEGDAENQTLFREIFTVASTLREAVLSGDYFSGMELFVDYWNGEGAWNAMPLKARTLLCTKLPKMVLDFHALFEEPARLEDFATLSIPTLLLRGNRSPAPSRRIVEMLAKTIPGCRVEAIVGAGHMSPITHAEAVNALIRRHLDATSAASLMAA